MSPDVAAAVLVFAGCALLIIPALPAIVELRLKRDAEPLAVIQQYGGEIRHFSQGFRSYIGALQEPLKICVDTSTTATGTLEKGDRYFITGKNGKIDFVSAGLKGKSWDLVLLTGADVMLPGGLTFSKEIYAAGNLVGGNGCVYRAILGDKDLQLGFGSEVMRWAHAAGQFRVERDCDLYGRISSDKAIYLDAGCRFQRLNAPVIAMGTGNFSGRGAILENSGPGREIPDFLTERKLVEGDLRIAEDEVITQNIVVRGNLLIGARAQIYGNVKATKKIEVEGGASVQGSLIGTRAIHIGPRCQVRGPIVGEHKITIGAHTKCGTADRPTTVSATTIEAQEGAVIFGTIWAREEGRVTPAP